MKKQYYIKVFIELIALIIIINILLLSCSVNPSSSDGNKNNQIYDKITESQGNSIINENMNIKPEYKEEAEETYEEKLKRLSYLEVWKYDDVTQKEITYMIPVDENGWIVAGSDEEYGVTAYINVKGSICSNSMVKVDYRGETIEYDWHFMNGIVLIESDDGSIYGRMAHGFPQFAFGDFIGDGSKQIAINLHTGRGTGVSVYELHIISLDDMTEIPVVDYGEQQEKLIQSERLNKEETTYDKLVYEFTIGNVTQILEVHYGSTDMFKPKDYMSFGPIVYYEVRNNDITITIGISVISLFYIGNLRGRVIYENGQFIIVDPVIEIYEEEAILRNYWDYLQ